MTLDTDTKVQVINSLTSSSTTAALSANQGRLLNQSVSDGKNQVANAITGKGVAASGSDSFATLANKINQIKSVPTKIVTENSNVSGNSTLTIAHSYGKMSGSVHVFGMYSTGYNSNTNTTGVYDNKCNLYFSGSGNYTFPSLFGAENYQFTNVYYDESNLYLVNNSVYSKSHIYFAFFIY